MKATLFILAVLVALNVSAHNTTVPPSTSASSGDSTAEGTSAAPADATAQADMTKINLTVANALIEADESDCFNGATSTIKVIVRWAVQTAGEKITDEDVAFYKQALLSMSISTQSTATMNADYKLFADNTSLTLVKDSSAGEFVFAVQLLCDTIQEKDEVIFAGFSIPQSYQTTVAFTQNNFAILIHDLHQRFSRDYVFRIAIGTNFDFINGPKLRDLFGEVYTFNPDVFSIRPANAAAINRRMARQYMAIHHRLTKKRLTMPKRDFEQNQDSIATLFYKPEWIRPGVLPRNALSIYQHHLSRLDAIKRNANKRRYGMYGTFYSSRSISAADLPVQDIGGVSIPRSNDGFVERVALDYTQLSFVADTYTYRVDTIRPAVDLQTDNIGVCLGALYNLEVHSKALDLYFALHTEVTRRYLTAEYNYETIGSATIKVDTTTFNNSFKTQSLTVDKINVRNATVTDYYLAIGLPFWIHYDVADLFVLPQGGVSWRSSRNAADDLNHIWRFQPFYWGFKFMLVENKFGFTLGGDIKSYIYYKDLKPEYTFKVSTIPYMTFTLSKSFNLTHFGDLIGLKTTPLNNNASGGGP